MTGTCLCLLYQYYATLPTAKKTILAYSTKLLIATLSLPLASSALFPIMRGVLGESLSHLIGNQIISFRRIKKDFYSCGKTWVYSSTICVNKGGNKPLKVKISLIPHAKINICHVSNLINNNKNLFRRESRTLVYSNRHQ